MADDNKDLRYLLDPYGDWAKGEGIPIHEGFCVDLHAIETKPWARMEINGALVHLDGRGDFVSILLYDLPPAAVSSPQQHLFEEVIFVVEGHGNAQIETHDGRVNSFEWGPNSIFAIPLNARYQLFNASGTQSARLASTCNLPLTMNLFRRDQFIFSNGTRFPEREGPGDPGWFSGEGTFVPGLRDIDMWETNFLADITGFALTPWDSRGAGSSTVQFSLADGTIHLHCSEMPMGTYKKAHRHGSDFHVFIVSGQGYSLFWHEGDKDFTRINWTHGSVFAPTDMIYHQHFNSSPGPVRYMATAMGSSVYPFTSDKVAIKMGVNVSVSDGGFQIDYQDQDARIHRLYLIELAKNGAECRMGEFMDDSVFLSAGG